MAGRESGAEREPRRLARAHKPARAQRTWLLMPRSLPAAQTSPTSSSRKGEECYRKVKKSFGRDPGERAEDHTTLSEASQPPPPALTYLLHLVMVELREEVGEQMRGDHFATARCSRVGKPRLERFGGRRTTRSDSFGSATGRGDSQRLKKTPTSDGPPG